jgi:hypothetical protein
MGSIISKTLLDFLLQFDGQAPCCGRPDQQLAAQLLFLVRIKNRIRLIPQTIQDGTDHLGVMQPFFFRTFILALVNSLD